MEREAERGREEGGGFLPRGLRSEANEIQGGSSGAVDAHDAAADGRDPSVHPFLCSIPGSFVGGGSQVFPRARGLA